MSDKTFYNGQFSSEHAKGDGYHPSILWKYACVTFNDYPLVGE